MLLRFAQCESAVNAPILSQLREQISLLSDRVAGECGRPTPRSFSHRRLLLKTHRAHPQAFASTRDRSFYVVVDFPPTHTQVCTGRAAVVLGRHIMPSNASRGSTRSQRSANRMRCTPLNQAPTLCMACVVMPNTHAAPVHLAGIGSASVLARSGNTCTVVASLKNNLSERTSLPRENTHIFT
jgi:hypothetical protein